MRRPTPDQPGPGQESVWDYPRPPRLEYSDRHVRVVLGGEVIADTRRALRILETSHPPAWYLPAEDFVDGALVRAAGSSFCEWKGVATYLDLVGGGVRAASAAWTYPDPVQAYAALAGHVSLYPAATDRCEVDGEVVRPQEGGFYGGWITSDVVGPFKGAPGTRGW
jgi:uncharacterized protein (DUF427 family)